MQLVRQYIIRLLLRLSRYSVGYRMENSAKSILGIGNALTDIVAVLPDDALLKEFNLPSGSMMHIDESASNIIWQRLKTMDVEYIPGGSVANTLAGTSILGMRSSFIGKVGDDELGELYKREQEGIGIKATLLKGALPSGRAMVFVTAPDSERTFAVCLGSALELSPSELKPEFFEGYDYFHIEGYLVHNRSLVRRAVELAKSAGSIISMDLANYRIVENNDSFLHDIVENYVDILFANEMEAKSFTKKEPREALDEMARMCKIAVVKLGPDGSMVKSGDEFYKIAPCEAKCIDATGAGDLYAAGFLYAHSLGMPIYICGQIGSVISSKVVEVIGSRIDAGRWMEAKEETNNIMYGN